ncbi:hypothetical protein RRG08_025264 [Elysia crispata]|uniref:C-type lectin domain-containing protein n=1 Tax=Elysia crispata TaxID=231223 RepID=A0AAE1ABA4_9GAST|nr:hypothetical protein RRG08_025264 [Elysia crispata]
MAGASSHGLIALWVFILFAGIIGAQVRSKDTRKFKTVSSSTPKMLRLPGKSNLNASTLRECAAKCKEQTRTNCYSFIYNDVAENCHLGSWTAADGHMVVKNCMADPNPSKVNRQPIDNRQGKLFTSACCKDEFILSTSNLQQIKCIFYSNLRKNFQDARADCLSRNSQLITFKTKAEMFFVKNLLACMEDTWVGIRDNCGNKGVDCNVNGSRKLFWVDNTELSGDVETAVFEKLGNKSREGCIQLGGRYKETFNDEECGASFFYVCEKDPMKEETYCL